MCFNNTTSILYDCNKNLTKKSIIIFVFSGLCIIISLIFTLVFWLSKPIWLPEEIKRNNLDDKDMDNKETDNKETDDKDMDNKETDNKETDNKETDDKETDNELINIDEDDNLININMEGVILL